MLSIFLSRLKRLSLNLAYLLVATFFLFPSVSSAADQAQFLGLGQFFAGGSSVANAVSADGQAVVGTSSFFDPVNPANNRGITYRWTAAEGMIDLGSLRTTGGGAAAFKVSNSGNVAVGWAFNNSGDQEVFRWTSSTGMVGLGLSGFGSVSDDGNVIAARSGNEAVRWTDTMGTVGLGIPSGFASSGVSDVSADGSVITGDLGMQLANGDWVIVPYRWTADTGIVPFSNYPVTDITNRLAISPDGTTVVGSVAIRSLGTETAFKWTLQGGFAYIPDPDGWDTAALGVAADNATIVGFRRDGGSGGQQQATIWDANGDMRLLRNVITTEYGLDLTGWTLERATDISADGRTIVGNGVNPLGFQEAWLVQLPTAVPVPAAMWLFGSGLLGLVGFARKRK